MPQIGDIVWAKEIGKPGWKYIWRECKSCGQEDWTRLDNTQRSDYRGRCWPCSRREHWTGDKNPAWNNRMTTNAEGYILVYRPNHAFANSKGFVYLHRLVALKKWGADLILRNDIHHKDGDRGNNALSNLELCSRKRHLERHRNKNGVLVKNNEQQRIGL